MFPIDVGLPDAASLSVRVIAYQWLALHYLGVLSLNWLDQAHLLKQLGYPVLFVSGYLETSLLLYLLAQAIRWSRSLLSGTNA